MLDTDIVLQILESLLIFPPLWFFLWLSTWLISTDLSTTSLFFFLLLLFHIYYWAHLVNFYIFASIIVHFSSRISTWFLNNFNFSVESFYLFTPSQDSFLILLNIFIIAFFELKTTTTQKPGLNIWAHSESLSNAAFLPHHPNYGSHLPASLHEL